LFPRGSEERRPDSVPEFDEKLNALLSNPDSMAQIMRLAQSLSGQAGESTGSAAVPPEPGRVPRDAVPPEPQPSRAEPDLLSSLTKGIDPKLLSRLLPLLGQLGGERDGNARQLLYALRPYLKAERQEKVERALQLARLIHVGKQLLSTWEG